MQQVNAIHNPLSNFHICEMHGAVETCVFLSFVLAVTIVRRVQMDALLKLRKFRSKQIKLLRSGKAVSNPIAVRKNIKIRARVMTNVAMPWFGREALTINIGRD
jgi:hypothetical protein